MSRCSGCALALPLRAFALILPYFHQFSLLIGPPGVPAAPTSAVLTSIFAPVIEDLLPGAHRTEPDGRSSEAHPVLIGDSALQAGPPRFYFVAFERRTLSTANPDCNRYHSSERTE